VRYITRVHLDESSGAALPAELEEYIPIGTPLPTGQIIAFVDIPLAEQLAPERYYVFVERWRRASSGSTQFVQLTPVPINHNYWPNNPWIGWANFSPDQGIPIRIVDQDPGAGDFVQELFHHPAGGWDKWEGGYHFLDHMDDLEHLVPNPKLRIWIADFDPPTVPAAWEITLAYPAGQIEVTGATLGRTHRSGGLVSVSTTSSPSGCEGSGTTHISVIDPDQQSLWVDVAYRRRDPTCERITASDFEPVENSTKAYDLEGNPILPAVADIDQEYDF
jgi:hypothetical protein